MFEWDLLRDNGERTLWPPAPGIPPAACLAVLSSRTLRDAVEVAMRYSEPPYAAGQLTFAEAAGEARLIFHDQEIPQDARAAHTERVMTAIQLFGRELLAVGMPMHRVSFRHSGPADTSRYRAIFGIDPIFGAAANEAAFDSMYLDLPLPQPTAWVRGTREQLCRNLLTRRHARAGVSGTVRDLLVRNPDAVPDQAAVAAELFMSPRTLSRRLNAEATSFRALLDEVRQMLAEELLCHTEMTTEQVATRLGYAEAASFIRAFRRWRGCPPQEFRSHTQRANSLVPQPV
ncbi:helix-turn-helix domain-containing protein [Nocardia sp. NPDC058058]|uniref:helix-turn-helix domain-containing protein n=1 Tax=Nocardia sp. NPDC058058 TaxID=3346317 RepID=UPI0036DA42F4